ncbi:hypothetical protein KOEU_34170 [Komagataeibacter europaeus]|uniref:Uncharacterized protein n=1 Tax=Komagataeibacter europaeus TaxID=33995 RepID=A0A0M0EDT7_KOMEU|nr:hypothetical protein KOEU_34170 [Komagataeibacter europaeus]
MKKTSRQDGSSHEGLEKAAQRNGPLLARRTGCQVVLYMSRVHLRSARPAILLRTTAGLLAYGSLHSISLPGRGQWVPCGGAR